MTKCCCKNPMALLANPCTRKAFDWDRCVSRHKNTGKTWYVSTGEQTSIAADYQQGTSTSINFSPFSQKLYWDFFPEIDPCAEVDPLEVYMEIEVVSEDSNIEQKLTMVNGTLLPYGFPYGNGNYYLIYKGHVTDPIPIDATTSVIESRLSALPTIGNGNVDVTGVVGGPWTIEFIGDLADADVDVIKVRSEISLDINNYQTVPGLSEEDQKMVSSVYGSVGSADYLDPAEWSKEATLIARGVEMIIYMYVLRGTWRLTLRATAYNNGPGGNIDYAIDAIRGIAHYTSGKSGCFYDEPIPFVFDTYTSIRYISGVPEDPKPPGEYSIGFPEEITFLSLDVGDFLD